MSFVDLIIIYLACGAPFGVYQLFVSENSGGSFGGTAAALLLWPLFAVRQLLRLFDPEAVRSRNLRDIRTAIEEAAFSETSAEDLFDFREVFDRYTGLAGSIRNTQASVEELLEAVDHPNSGLAARCHGRLNQRRIALHRDRAKHEFITLLSSASTEKAGPAIARQLERLTPLVGEDELALDRRPSVARSGHFDAQASPRSPAAKVDVTRVGS